MTEFFSKLTGFLDSGPLNQVEFHPPVSLPAGTRILVAPPELPDDIRWSRLTEEGRRDVDSDGCITVRPMKINGYEPQH